MSDEPHDILDEATPFTEHDFLTTLAYFRNRERRSSLYGEWITETEQETLYREKKRKRRKKVSK